MHQSLMALIVAGMVSLGGVVSGSPGVEGTSATASPGALRSIDTAGGWLNTPPLTAASLRGKVVLIQFWTFSCINWRRSLPYVRAWDQKLLAARMRRPSRA